MEDNVLVHQALLYDSAQEFVAASIPFVRAGLERGDAVFAATTPRNIEALRDALGADAARVELEDSTTWQTRPYDRLHAFRRMAERLPEGAGLRAMGEPVWGGSPAVVRQWARYESVVNLALADAPMRFVCLYDTSALPDDILEHARHTHPELVEHGAEMPCPSFVSPEEFLPGRPPSPPEHPAELPLESVPFRRLLAERARDAGLSEPRVAELVLAANEVATNALMHGMPPFRASLWQQDGELICQIADSGRGLADPLAGWLPPDDGAVHGWGLPIARQLCDALEIAPSDRGGTTASLHVSLAA
jgi:anti-sigma regulatory factor (Ser/Thr protein kinase)